jgi:DnaJ-class molecular chaperone
MDYYKILNVEKNASQEEIKKNYRKMSLKMHPDKGGDADKFKELNEAFQILGDEKKRKEYDLNLEFGNRKMNMGFDMPENMGIPIDILKMMFAGGNIPNNIPFFNFSQSMNSGNGPNIRIFRNGVEQYNPMSKPVPIIKTIEITLEEAYNGVNKPVDIERWIKEEELKRVEKETLYINIPKGSDNNELILLRDKGNIISENNKGDIKIFLKVINNTIFERQGIDLIYKKKISLKEALCGFSFEIKYFNDRTFNIKNENNIIKQGCNKIVQGLGLTRGEQSGNLIIMFEIEFPDILSKEQTDKLREILN